MAEGEQSPGLQLRHWHWLKKWVTKSWDKNLEKKKILNKAESMLRDRTKFMEGGHWSKIGEGHVFLVLV